MNGKLHPTTGVVLAGGRGTRMQYADKGLLPFAGRPLAARVLDALRPQVARLLISANRNLERYAALGVPVVPDTIPGFQGPLAGMLAGLRHAGTDWVLFAPCDALYLPENLAQRLHAALPANGTSAYAAAGSSNAMYACCLLHRSLAGEIETALLDGRRSVRDFLAACGAIAVDFPDWPRHLRNANTPDDLVRACA
jgi:molybdopterin-guanine dinucleotide biosynthesis protein A